MSSIRVEDPRKRRPTSRRVFGALPQFRAASFVPPAGDEVDLDARVEVAERLGELLGTHPPVATDQLAALVAFDLCKRRPNRQSSERRLEGRRTTYPRACDPDRQHPRPDRERDRGRGRHHDRTIVGRPLHGRDVLRALDTVLQQDLESLREAQQQVGMGDDGLSAGSAAERRELADLLDGDDLPGHIARIRSIAGAHPNGASCCDARQQRARRVEARRASPASSRPILGRRRGGARRSPEAAGRSRPQRGGLSG